MWVAFLSLIIGIVISFWLPRRRVWGRLDARRPPVARRCGPIATWTPGASSVALLDDLVAARRAGPPGGTPASPATG